MKRWLRSLGTFGLLGLIAVSGALSASAMSPAWGKAMNVPGLAALGHRNGVNSVSCAPAGDCVAGGDYLDTSGHGQAFVVDERNGSWRKAIEVPGMPTLNSGGYATVNSVACATSGNCTAGGTYEDSSQRIQAFVVDETNGVWRNAIEVPGTAGFAGAGVDSVSCGTAGNCAAGGSYTDAYSHEHAFVVSETNGVWGNAVEVPGMAALNSDAAYVSSLSCPTAGNCAAGGLYVDGAGNHQVFVVDETDGNWGNAIEVPGTPALNSDGYATLNSLSCASAGNCTAGGYYNYDVTPEGFNYGRAFVVDETSGSWGTAIEVPGTATLGVGGFAGVTSVSCATAGNCAAVGSYTDGSIRAQAFVSSETYGSWGKAIVLPGTATLNKGGWADVASVSCPTAGNCVALGDYHDARKDVYAVNRAFLADERNGRWHKAFDVPGTAALYRGGVGYPGVSAVSCATVSNCAAGGTYRRSGIYRGFVVRSVRARRHG